MPQTFSAATHCWLKTTGFRSSRSPHNVPNDDLSVLDIHNLFFEMLPVDARPGMNNVLTLFAMHSLSSLSTSITGDSPQSRPQQPVLRSYLIYYRYYLILFRIMCCTTPQSPENSLQSLTMILNLCPTSNNSKCSLLLSSQATSVNFKSTVPLSPCICPSGHTYDC